MAAPGTLGTWEGLASRRKLTQHAGSVPMTIRSSVHPSSIHSTASLWHDGKDVSLSLLPLEIAVVSVVLVRVALWEIREGEERLKWKKEKAGQIKDTVPVSVDGFFFLLFFFICNS